MDEDAVTDANAACLQTGGKTADGVGKGAIAPLRAFALKWFPDQKGVIAAFFASLAGIFSSPGSRISSA